LLKSELIYAQNLDVDNNKENSSLSFHDTVRIAEPRAFASSFLLNTGQERQREERLLEANSFVLSTSMFSSFCRTQYFLRFADPRGSVTKLNDPLHCLAIASPPQGQSAM
jgi:hypothetical protein